MAHMVSHLSEEMENVGLGSHNGDAGTFKKSLPPVTPAKTKKAAIVPSATMFKKIDENVKNVPEPTRLSVEKLVAHLCKAASTDIEKVRSFFVWICNNIGFQSKEENKVNPARLDAVSTLRMGSGSHANLMTAFCKEASIPVVTIHGCSKDHQSDREFSLGESNHSWNAVYVNGEWRLIDCCWGSGYTDTNAKFQQQLNEFWFFTDPEMFVYDHFPSDSAWQLLDKPITIEEFNKVPAIAKKARELGLKLTSHREPVISVQKEVTIQFSTEICPLSTITADLLSADGEKVNSHRCITRIDKQTFEIRVVPPQIGQYTLHLFGKTRAYIHAKYKHLVEYTLKVETISAEKVVFPNHFNAWGPEPNYAEYGFASSIEKMSTFETDTNEMTVRLDQSRKNTVTPKLIAVSDSNEDLEKYTMLSAKAGAIDVHCRFPTCGYYRLDIYAADPKSEKHELSAYLLRGKSGTQHSAASFLIECRSRETSKIYPKSNIFAVLERECELLEPMDRELPSETFVTFRMKSPCLREAMIAIKTDQKYQDRGVDSLGELTCTDNVFSGRIKTPAKGKNVFLSGSTVTPCTVCETIYTFVTV